MIELDDRFPLWNQMTPEWQASIKMNGCVSNPCLNGDETCHCWVAAQRMRDPAHRQRSREEIGTRAW